MKLSMRSHYGARAVMDLAKYFNQGPIQSAEIAARQAIPETYLEQLLTTLRKHGIVRSTRGPHGGHELARPPAEILCSELVQALEGPLLEPDLADDELPRPGRSCGLDEVWREVLGAVQQILSTTSVQDLVDRQSAGESRAMYHI